MNQRFTLDTHGRTSAIQAEGTSTHFVLPGMVNAHSHSFQRIMRGKVEKKQQGQGRDDFWSWRELMYQIAAQATAAELETIGTWCFLDCLKTGFTQVGEFHYVHHRPSGEPYEPPYHLGQCLMRAADNVGIRLTVLHAAYHWNGPEQPAQGAQKRFIFDSVEHYLAHVGNALNETKNSGHSQGLAIHSIRAVPESWLAPIAEYAVSHRLPLHVHAAEQEKELDVCQQAYGCSPIGLLAKHGVLGPHTTVIHGTHVNQSDIALLADSGATVCICPSTERNLGDGLAPIADYLDNGVPLTIGSDSHVRIDAVDELRSLEDHERLRLQRRLVWLDHNSNLTEGLISVACKNGYRSLMPWGNGHNVDEVWVKIPLHLQACDPEHITQDWLLGGSGQDVSHVKVNGKWVLEDYKSTLLDEFELARKVGAILSKY